MSNGIQYVTSEAVAGDLIGQAVKVCPLRGLIQVTILYGDGDMDHDVTVSLDRDPASKEVTDNKTLFTIVQDRTYTVSVQSQHWAARYKTEYQAKAKPNHHTLVTIPVYKKPSLTVTCNDHHFAPGPETLSAKYTTNNLAGDTLKLTVKGTNYGGDDIIYEQEDVASGNGDHVLNWQGAANKGALNGGLLTPLHSPYTLRVEAENSGIYDEKQFHVLYHSVSIAMGTYTADGAAPVEGTHLIHWIQYKLNELGYFAGPVDGVRGAQTDRAIKRYLYQHPDLEETLRDPHTKAAFKDEIRNNRQLRTIIQRDRLPTPDETARIYIDHNYFYHALRDFSLDTGHITRDQDKLDRFEIPVEATITLMGRADADGSGAGVASPQAVGVVDIEWTVDEAAEDTSGLHNGTDDNIPSRTRQYVNAALTATEDGDGRNNCPTTHGGARQAVNPNVGYFRIGGDLPPFTSSNPNGDIVKVPAYQGGVNKRGKAGILFRGSVVAGDNYRITAKISFRGRPNEQALKQAHSQTMGYKAWDDILLAQTGRMTLWRQHRISTVINWPAPAAAINWAQVAAEYAHAYCELDYGHIDVVNAATMRARTFLGQGFELIMAPHIAASIRDDRNQMNVVWDNNSLFHTNYVPPVQGGRETARTYVRRVRADAKGRISTDFLQGFAEGVFLFTPERGGIIIHGRWIPAVTATHRPLCGLRTGQNEDFEMGLMCIGLTRGVVVLSHSMFPDYQDRFIVTHEMGHSRFLNHHETGSNPQAPTASDTPTHHDINDHNCTMCYPSGIPTRNPSRGHKVSWDDGQPEHSAFCGKCLLKLRGWNVTTAPMPDRS